MAWEEATEGGRGLSGAGAAEMAWEEATRRVAGAGAAEMAWEEATEGERGLATEGGRGLRVRNRCCRNRMGVGYGGGARSRSLLPFLQLQPQRLSASCHFCSSSPSDSQRPLKPRSPSVASSRAISAAPAPATLSVHSNLAPRGRLLNENPSISDAFGNKRLANYILHMRTQVT